MGSDPVPQRCGERISGGGTSNPPLGAGAQGIRPRARLRVVNAAGRRVRPVLFTTRVRTSGTQSRSRDSWGNKK